MFSVNPNQEPSNRTSQQTRFNKKKTGAEESFVLDFAYNPEAVEKLYSKLGSAGRSIDASKKVEYAWIFTVINDPENIKWGEWNDTENKVLLEVPIMSSKSFIFGYADIIIIGNKYRKSEWTNSKGTQLSATETIKSLLIEVKSERTSVLDLIKQLKSYTQFHDGLPVFIHLYDLEDREIRALKANGIHPVDGRLLV